jgi:Arc/MetJ-type ribon-helix-helix transcriptional regulator
LKNNVVVAAKIPESLAEKVKQKVDADGYISVSDYIRHFLRESVKHLK